MHTDCLIIGSGIAGLVCAYNLAKTGANITIISRTKLQESNSFLAQGGIIYKGKDDSPTKLSEDINKAGVYLSNPLAIQQLCQLGPKLVKDILVDELKVNFNCD